MSPRTLTLQQAYVQALYLLKISTLTVETNMGSAQAPAPCRTSFKVVLISDYIRLQEIQTIQGSKGYRTKKLYKQGSLS